MDLVFREEHEELRRVVRRFLEERSPLAEVRRLMVAPEGYDRAVWAAMGEELGLQGLSLPEEHGGSGSFVELVLVAEEMGRALLCAPYLSTVVLAGHSILASGDQVAAQDFLPGIASGRTVATLAFVEDDGRWDMDQVSTVATRNGATSNGDAWMLDGHKSFVIDGQHAELILVVARAAEGVPGWRRGAAAGEAGLSLYAVHAGAEGLTAAPLVTLDPTRRQARLELAGVPARLIGDLGGAARGLARALDLAAVALAGEQVGGAQRCLEMSVEHARTRVQFGRPIGSFQAIKHRCAEMMAEVETARSLAGHAGRAAAVDADELPVAASMAKARCSEAYMHAAAETIQVHGGIGFTWEHDAHLYFRRAKSSQLILGDPAYHKERLVQRLGI